MNGPRIATMAWRNLWRQKRRTLLTLASIAFGGFLAVMMTSFQDRSFSDFIDTAARLGAGHVTVQHPDYLDRPSLSRTVTGTGAVHEAALATPGVKAVVDRVMGETMLATSSDSFGAAFIAYDPAQESDQTLRFLGGVKEGALYQTADDKGIILGSGLARNLGASLGDKVVFTMMDKNGEVVAGMGRLSGVISTGAATTDAAICLLPINVVRRTLGYAPDEATQVAVFLDDSRDSGQIAERLQGRLSAGQSALPWYKVTPDLKAFVAMKIGGGRVIQIIIGLLVAAGIFNTLFVSVMERVREFGVMMALGYTPGQLYRMVMWESLFLALVGVGAGLAITAGPYWYWSNTGIDMSAAYGTNGMDIGGVGFDPILHIGIYPENAMIIVVAILVATLAAGLYPAWKAGRVNPVDSIKLV